jgi:uncharacterized membrane protein YhaH (DUF805 family)
LSPASDAAKLESEARETGMMDTDWRTLFVSADGRLGRAPFWVATAILLLAWGTYQSVLNVPLLLLTGWIVYPLLIFFAVCVLSKRLHDRGRSGWYAALIIVALIAIWPFRGVIDFLFLIVMVWSVVELAILTGEQGANRFGPNPVKFAK